MTKIKSIFGIAALILVIGLLAGCAAPTALVSTPSPEMETMVSNTPEKTDATVPGETATVEATTVTPEVTVSPSGDDDFKVEIEDFAFSPATLTVKVGTTVTWTNKDNVGHTATSDTGVFDSGMLQKGESYSFTFSQAGTYPYFCAPHPYMVGTIVVVE